MSEPITEREFRKLWDVIPDPKDGDLRHKLGYEHMVMRRRALEWLAVSLPDASDSHREKEADLAIQRFWRSVPSFSEICKVRSARAKWETNRDWIEGKFERQGMTRPEWEYLVERLAGVNDPTGQMILQRAINVLKGE